MFNLYLISIKKIVCSRAKSYKNDLNIHPTKISAKSINYLGNHSQGDKPFFDHKSCINIIVINHQIKFELPSTFL